MATRTLNTRLQLKYDSYDNWSTNNPVLLSGEIAITTIETNTGNVQQAPVVMMKVGDGTSTYNDLKFVSGLAANVHNWALSETKPTYTANEISGLSDYINGEIEDTNTTYQLVKVDGYTYKLQSKEVNGDWADVTDGTITIPKYDDTEVKNSISALEELVGETSVAAQIAAEIAKLADVYDPKGSAGQALEDAKAYTKEYADGKDAAIEAAQEAANKAQEEVDALEEVVGTVTEGSTVVGMITAAEEAAKEYADGKDEAIAAAQSAADKAQEEVDAVEEKLGTIPEGKTVSDMITDAQTAATYDDTQVKADIKANADAITNLKADSETEGSIDYKIAQAVAAIMENPDETMNSINELVTWINGHANEALELSNDVEANKKAIAALEELVGSEDVATQITDAITAALKADGVDKYALATDLTAAINRIADLEKDTHTHSNKALLDTYTQTEADLADAVDKRHEHANADVLDDITEEKVTNWDSAKTIADELKETIGEVEEGKTLIDIIGDAQEAATYDDSEVRELITQNATAIGEVEDRVEALETNAVQTGDTLILQCGNSVIA